MNTILLALPVIVGRNRDWKYRRKVQPRPSSLISRDDLPWTLFYTFRFDFACSLVRLVSTQINLGRGLHLLPGAEGK